MNGADVTDARWQRGASEGSGMKKLTRADYERELHRLQVELVKLQEWVRSTGARGRGAVRGARRRGQGWRDHAHHAVPQPTDRACRRASGADRPREVAVVLRALRRAPAVGRRGRAVRPLLVQPGGRRARHGVLHTTTSTGGSSHQCPVFERMLIEDGVILREVLVLGERRRAREAVPGPPGTIR